MATGSAKVVDSGSSLTNTVRDAAGQAVHDAQNAGASKKDVIKARDAAKERVYSGAVQAINSGGSYNGMSAQQLRKEIVQSRDHLQNMQNAGFYDAQWNPTSKASQTPNKVSTNMQVLSFEPAAVQPKDLGIRQRFRYEAMQLKESKHPIVKTAASYLPNYYDPEVVKKTEENALDFNNISSFVFDPVSSSGLKATESEKNPLRVDKNVVVDSALEGLFYGYTGEDVSGKGAIIQAAGNRGTNWIDDKAGRLHEWSMRNLDGRFGAVGSFIRGVAPDSVVGVGTLLSEGTKTITAGFREARKSGMGLTGSTRSQAMSTSLAKMLGFGAGTIAGGTANAAKNDPIAFAGGLIGTGGAAGVGKLGTGVGKFRLKMYKETKGLTHVPLDKLADPVHVSYGEKLFMGNEVIKAENMHVFGTSKGTMADGVKLLENAKNKYPGVVEADSTMIIHASPSKFENVSTNPKFEISEVLKGNSSEPGLFGAHELVPYFMKVPHFKTDLLGFSNPFKSNKTLKNASPRALFIENKGGVKAPPANLLNADPRSFYTTHKMKAGLDAGRYTEIEAVVPAKRMTTPAGDYMGVSYPKTKSSAAVLYLTEKKFKTSVKQPVTIFGKTIGIDLSVPIERRIVVTADDMALISTSTKTKSGFSSPKVTGIKNMFSIKKKTPTATAALPTLTKKTTNTKVRPSKTTKKSTRKTSSESSRSSSKQTSYPLIDLTYGIPSASRGAKSKTKSSKARGGYYNPTSKSMASSPGYSSGGKSTPASKTAASKATTRPIVQKHTSKKEKKEPITGPKRTKKTTARKTQKEFRINPLKGLKI